MPRLLSYDMMMDRPRPSEVYAEIKESLEYFLSRNGDWDIPHYTTKENIIAELRQQLADAEPQKNDHYWPDEMEDDIDRLW